MSVGLKGVSVLKAETKKVSDVLFSVSEATVKHPFISTFQLSEPDSLDPIKVKYLPPVQLLIVCSMLMFAKGFL